MKVCVFTTKVSQNYYLIGASCKDYLITFYNLDYMMLATSDVYCHPPLHVLKEG